MRIYLFIMIISMTAFNCAEEIDEIEWRVGASLPPVDGMKDQPGLAGPVTGIINDQLLVSGGANFPDGMPWHGAKKVYHDAIYLLGRKGKSFTVAPLSKQKLPQPVAYCANTMIPGALVYLGGENQQGISDKVVMIKSGNASNKLIFSELPPLPVALTNLSATYSDQVIYAGGGNTKEGASSKFFALDLSKPGTGWKALPDMPVKIAYGVMVAQSNGHHICIYLIGGRRKNNNGLSDIFNTVYQFDPTTNQWNEKHSLPYRVSAGTGIAFKSNGILLLGGDKGDTFSREEKLNLAIRNESDEQKNKILVKERIALLEAHPGFTSEVLLYNTVADTWDKTNPLPPGAAVTTTAIKWGNEIIIPSGEIKAGVRTPKIMVGKVKDSR